MKNIARAWILPGLLICLIVWGGVGAGRALAQEIGSLTLSWTAPGDDGHAGIATSFDLRFSTTPLNDSTWQFAYQVDDEPVPGEDGTLHSYTFNNLILHRRYYFAIKTIDEYGNSSPMSNVVIRVIGGYVCGDANGDSFVNIVDASFVINYLFYDGYPPYPIEAADANNDGMTNIVDASYLVNFIFAGGQEPCPNN